MHNPHSRPAVQRCALCVVCVCTVLLCSSCQTPIRSIGSLVEKDPRFSRIVPPDAHIEVLAEGFDWTEGPVWVADGDYLLFSDIPRNTIYKWKEGEGISTFMHPSGYTGTTPRKGEPGSNGLTLDQDDIGYSIIEKQEGQWTMESC